jgi:hypothetical protein
MFMMYYLARFSGKKPHRRPGGTTCGMRTIDGHVGCWLLLLQLSHCLFKYKYSFCQERLAAG